MIPSVLLDQARGQAGHAERLVQAYLISELNLVTLSRCAMFVAELIVSVPIMGQMWV